MPFATYMTWQLDGEKAEYKEGKIDVILNSIFLNGTKRRKIVDMSTLPHHDGVGNISLHFSCGGSIEATLVGSAAATAFVEDCVEVLVRRLGKGKLPPTRRSSTQDTADSTDSNLKVKCEASQMNDGVGGPSVEEESLKQAPLSLEACLDQAVSELPQLSFARTLLSRICSSQPAKTSPTSLLQVCEAFDKQAAEKEQKRRDEEKDIRKQLTAAKEQCTRLLTGRELLEKEFKSLCARLEAADSKSTHLERLLREQNTSRAKAEPPAKRQRVQTQKGSETSDEFVRALAEFEVAPLKNCAVDAREALKKKIFLKWHPDKQPSKEHEVLSTKVMQAIQNETLWKV
mmetsp:Transcript_113503/g.177494  ORF Transcript_113503/g.177494 Transcript_113503/m.177494 type:complete len:344 (+) Transcript_113503:66-1097(+)